MTYGVHVEGVLVTREMLVRHGREQFIPDLRLGTADGDAEFAQPLAAIDLARKLKRDDPGHLVTIVLFT
jgi:hypothetical protein